LLNIQLLIDKRTNKWLSVYWKWYYYPWI